MSSDKTRAERIEILAAIEHDQWMTWAKSLMENESLSATRVERWSSLMVPYADLSEDMKGHDRKWARLVLDALPPDPPRGDGWDALRELRTWVEREIDPADRQQSVLDEIDRLLAAAPKEPEPAKSPAEPAQDDESLLHKANDCLSRVCEGQRFKLTATVPARPGVDDDLVLRDGIEAGLRLAREKADLRAEVERLRAFRQRPDRLLQHDHSPGATYANCIRCVADERDAFEAKLAAAESYIHDLNELLNSAVGRAVDAEVRIAEMRNAAQAVLDQSLISVTTLRASLLRIAELGKGGA